MHGARNVAIIFARLDPVHLTARSGAARLIAYMGRTIIADRGSAARLSASGGRPRHQEVMLPADYPAEFDVPAILATALDHAELQKVRTPLEDGSFATGGVEPHAGVAAR